MPPTHIAAICWLVEGKVFWQLLSWEWQSAAFRCRFRVVKPFYSRLLPLLICREPLWPVSSSRHPWEVSGGAAFITLSHRSVLPRFTPTSPGKMSWRQRRNFAFLILTLRVWCLSTALEHTGNEGEYATYLLTFLFFDILLFMWCCRWGATSRSFERNL